MSSLVISRVEKKNPKRLRVVMVMALESNEKKQRYLRSKIYWTYYLYYYKNALVGAIK